MDREPLRHQIERELGYVRNYAVEKLSRSSNIVTTFLRAQMWTTAFTTRAYATAIDLKKESYFDRREEFDEHKIELEFNMRKKIMVAIGSLASAGLDIGTGILAAMHSYNYDPFSMELGRISQEFWTIKGYTNFISLATLPIQMGIEKCKRLEKAVQESLEKKVN